MSKVNADAIKPRDTGVDITLGITGDTTVISADSINSNTVKDSGGNTLWSSNGSGTLSSVNSGLKGNLVLLQTQTASNSASISFTSGIDSTYDVYIFKFISITSTSDAAHMSFQMGSSYDTNMTSTNFQARHSEDNTVADLAYDNGWDQSGGTGFQQLLIKLGTGASKAGSGELYVFSPSSTTYVKQFLFRGTTFASNDYAYDSYTAGYFNVTTALSQIQFKATAGNLDTGTLKMYGLSG